MIFDELHGSDLAQIHRGETPKRHSDDQHDTSGAGNGHFLLQALCTTTSRKTVPGSGCRLLLRGHTGRIQRMPHGQIPHYYSGEGGRLDAWRRGLVEMAQVQVKRSKRWDLGRTMAISRTSITMRVVGSRTVACTASPPRWGARSGSGHYFAHLQFFSFPRHGLVTVAVEQFGEASQNISRGSFDSNLQCLCVRGSQYVT